MSSTKPPCSYSEPGVLRLADLQLCDGVGGDGVGESERIRAVDLDFTHVADVEQADVLAHGVVLFEDAGILDGHVPAAEVDHPGAQLTVRRVERGGLERGCGLSHGCFRRADYYFTAGQAAGRVQGGLGLGIGNYLKAPDGRVLVVEDLEDSIDLGELDHILNPLGEFHELELSAPAGGRGVGCH